MNKRAVERAITAQANSSQNQKLPASKPDYVVKAATPSGQKPVPQVQTKQVS